MNAATTDVTVNLVFEDQSFHKCVSEFEALAIYATVAVEPESLNDLETGLERYCSRERAEEICQEWRTGLNEPPNGPTLVLDFIGHCTAINNLPFDKNIPSLKYDEDTTIRCRFSWPDDWIISDEEHYFSWAEYSKQRRAEQQAIRRLETRSIMYDTFVEFALATAQSTGHEFDIAKTHKSWLVTERDDLQQKSPRYWLLYNIDHLRRDSDAQECLWFARQQQPPAIDVESNAYRFALFGPHEFATYYEMCRHILKWLADIEPELRNEITIDLVLAERNKWLNSVYDGFVPSYVIHQERKRIPLINEEEFNDHDCPICKILGPHGFGFWHPYGQDVDFDFEFTPCKTREEWELHYEYLYIESQEVPKDAALPEQYQKVIGDSDDDGELFLEDGEDTYESDDTIDETLVVEVVEDDPPPISVGEFTENRIWKNSTINRDAMRQLSPVQFIAVLMHGIMFCFAELTQDLGESKSVANQDLGSYAPLLLADVDNLNEAVRERSLWTVKSLVGSLQNTLSDIRAIAADMESETNLVAKCVDLHRLLSELGVSLVALEPEDKELQA